MIPREFCGCKKDAEGNIRLCRGHSNVPDVATLKAENQKLRKPCAKWPRTITIDATHENLIRENEQLKEENQKFLKALEFYGFNIKTLRGK